jgi:hypothetical protein
VSALPVEPQDSGQELQQQIAQKYPDLTVSSREGTLIIRGSFPVIHQDEVLTRFQIQIEWSESDIEAPILWEIGGRVPWDDRRHVDAGDNGKACPIVPEEWLLRPRVQRTALHYLDGPVRDFFIAQTIVEQGGNWPWQDQRKHGSEGLLQAYGEMTGLTNPADIRLALDHLSLENFSGRVRCPYCGGKRVRDCHLQQLWRLRQKIPVHIAKLARLRLRDNRRR